MKKYLLISLLFVFPYFSFAQEYVKDQKLYPPLYQHASLDAFGSSVSLYGNYAVVGEPWYAGSGRVSIFEYDGKSWELVAQLYPSEPQEGAEFGISVSMWGDTVVVGAPMNDEGGYRCGIVYVYGKPEKGWCDMKETFRLLPEDAGAYKNFGRSVSLTKDLLAVGSMGNNDLLDPPAVYLYLKEKEWTEKTSYVKLTTSDNAYGYHFGTSLDICGNTVVVGAPTTPPAYKGKVYVYEMPSGGWTDMTENASLTASDGENYDNFGLSVATNGEAVVVGMHSTINYRREGEAYLFVRPSGGWTDMTQTAVLSPSNGGEGDWFGYSVDIAGDTVVVGALMTDGNGSRSGALYVYGKPLTGWADATQDAMLTATPAKSQGLGQAVSISGNRILAGAPRADEEGLGSGAAYLYEKKEKYWKDATEDVKFLPKTYANNRGDKFGSVMDVDGEYAVVGSEGYDHASGRAIVYHYVAGRWEQAAVLTASDASASAHFGSSVSISGDVVVVGAPGYDDYTGQVYLFEKPAAGWQDMTETARLTATGLSGQDALGSAVAVSGDIVVAGAPNHHGTNYYEGAVYLYRRPAGGWSDMTQTATLLPSDLAGWDHFGSAVAVAGTVVAAGSPDDDDRGSSSGSVYLFEEPAGGWQDMHETAKLLPPYNSDRLKMGEVIALDSTVLAAGCINDDVNGYGSGSVYLFERPAGGWSSGIAGIRITPSDSRQFLNFGSSVDIRGDRLVAGGWHDNTYGLNSGAAYLFRKPAEGWSGTLSGEKLLAGDGTQNDLFGSAVALADDMILVGAEREDGGGIRGGAVYVFRQYDTVVITRQPAGSGDLCDGSTVLLSVAAAGATTYHWQVSMDEGSSFSDLQDDTVYSGVTDDTLTVLFSPALDSALYRCVVANPAYMVYSDTVRLTLDALPPVVTLHNDTVWLDAQGEGVLLPEQLVTATDNCGILDTIFSQESFSCAGAGTIVPVEITVHDVNGNGFTGSAGVYVADTVRPVLEVQDITVQLDEQGRAVITPAEVVTAASDNCGVADTLLDRDTLTTADIGAVQITVTLRDEQDNVTEKIVTVTVEEYTGIGNSRIKGIRIYPNPAGDYLHVAADGSTIRSLTVTDVAGRRVLMRRGPVTAVRLDVSDLREGIYFLRVETDQGRGIYRFVKK